MIIYSLIKKKIAVESATLERSRPTQRRKMGWESLKEIWNKGTLFDDPLAVSKISK